jgi:hypothetical protein
MRQFSNPDVSSNISGSAHTIPTGRRPRVLFDAFNLEATSDDIQEEAKVEYNADKKPAKVFFFFHIIIFSADSSYNSLVLPGHFEKNRLFA